MRLYVLVCLLFNGVLSVSDNMEAITSCWLITLQDNEKSKTFDHVVESVAKRYSENDRNKIIHNLRVYMVKKCFSQIRNSDSKQIIDDFEKGNEFHTTYRNIVKGFDYTQYIKDLKNKDIIQNQQLDDTISEIISQLETEVLKETRKILNEKTPSISVMGLDINYLIVFPIIGAFGLIIFGIKAYKSLNNIKTIKKNQ